MASQLVSNQALTARRRLLIAAVKTTTSATVGRAWTSMPNHGAEFQPDFARVAGPAIIAGQSRAIDLTVASLARILSATPQLDRQAVLDGAQVDLTSPFKAFGHALNDGQSIEDALNVGFDAAQTIAADGVQWVARSSSSAFDHAVTGWERVPDGNACDWCIEVAGQTYRSAESASFGHAGCGCDVEPAA